MRSAARAAAIARRSGSSTAGAPRPPSPRLWGISRHSFRAKLRSACWRASAKELHATRVADAVLFVRKLVGGIFLRARASERLAALSGPRDALNHLRNAG